MISQKLLAMLEYLHNSCEYPPFAGGSVRKHTSGARFRPRVFSVLGRTDHNPELDSVARLLRLFDCYRGLGQGFSQLPGITKIRP